jgi:hypothetical protein
MPLDVRPPKTVALTGDKRAVARYSPLESLQIEEVRIKPVCNQPKELASLDWS